MLLPSTQGVNFSSIPVINPDYFLYKCYYLHLLWLVNAEGARPANGIKWLLYPTILAGKGFQGTWCWLTPPGPPSTLGWARGTCEAVAPGCSSEGQHTSCIWVGGTEQVGADKFGHFFQIVIQNLDIFKQWFRIYGVTHIRQLIISILEVSWRSPCEGGELALPSLDFSPFILCSFPHNSI